MLYDKHPTVRNIDVNNRSQLDLQSTDDQNPSSGSEKCNQFTNIENSAYTSTFDQCENKILKKSNDIKMSVIAFRVTQILWFGASDIPSMFMGAFLKSRGLTLVELSSAYTFNFIFTFLTSLVTGIISDKIGNARPLLLFLMMSTPLVLISMLLTPNINSCFCFQLEKNVSFTKLFDKNQTSNVCYVRCLYNHTNDLLLQQNNLKNVSLIESSDFAIGDNTDCDFSTNAASDNIFNAHKIKCRDMCVNESNEKCINVRKSYLVAVYAVLNTLFYSVYSSGHRFMNYVAVSLSVVNSGFHLGKEFLIGRCGSLLVIVITAFVLNIDKSSESGTTFDSIIWIAAGIQICAFFAAFFIKVPLTSSGNNMLKKSFTLMKDIKVLAIILLVFVAGNGYAFERTLLMIFLGEIKAPRIVISLHSVAVLVYGFPVLFTSQWWYRKFGPYNIFVLCLLAYTVNNFLYSFVVIPWWCLILDVTVAFSNHLFWVTVVKHCFEVAPTGFSATLNSLAGSVHYGIGQSSGVFFGGMLMNYLGSRNAYRVMAAIFFTAAVLFSIFMFTRRNFQPLPTTEDGIDDERTKDIEGPNNLDNEVM